MLIAIATQSDTFLAEDAGRSSWKLDSKREGEGSWAAWARVEMIDYRDLVSRKEDGPPDGSWFLHEWVSLVVRGSKG